LRMRGRSGRWRGFAPIWRAMRRRGSNFTSVLQWCRRWACAGNILFDKRAHYARFELFLEVDDVLGKFRCWATRLRRIRRRSSISDAARRPPGVWEAALIPKLHGDADDGVILLRIPAATVDESDTTGMATARGREWFRLVELPGDGRVGLRGHAASSLSFWVNLCLRGRGDVAQSAL